MQTDAIDILEESLTIDTATGPLAAVLAYPFAGPTLGAVLVAGPHPLMGGGLQNNVVRSVARGMAEHGFVTLRFCYGGAGPTAETMSDFWDTGRTRDDPERIAEARDALVRLPSIWSQHCILIGYSFGAYVVSELLSETTPSHVVLIGPTLRQHRFDRLQRSTVPKLILSADNDFATPLDCTRAWFDNARRPVDLVVIDAAEHFYRGVEDRLVSEILQWL